MGQFIYHHLTRCTSGRIGVSSSTWLDAWKLPCVCLIFFFFLQKNSLTIVGSVSRGWIAIKKIKTHQFYSSKGKKKINLCGMFHIWHSERTHVRGGRFESVCSPFLNSDFLIAAGESRPPTPSVRHPVHPLPGSGLWLRGGRPGCAQEAKTSSSRYNPGASLLQPPAGEHVYIHVHLCVCLYLSQTEHLWVLPLSGWQNPLGRCPIPHSTSSTDPVIYPKTH